MSSGARIPSLTTLLPLRINKELDPDSSIPFLKPALGNGPNSVRGPARGGMMEILSSLNQKKKAFDDTYIGSPKSPYNSIGKNGFDGHPEIVDSMYTHHLECQYIKPQRYIDDVTMEMMKSKAEQTLQIINNHNEWAEHGYINTINESKSDLTIVTKNDKTGIDTTTYCSSQYPDNSNSDGNDSCNMEENCLSKHGIARISLDAPSMLIKEKQKNNQRASSSPPLSSRAPKINNEDSECDNNNKNVENSVSDELENISENKEQVPIFRFPKNAAYIYKGFENMQSQTIDEEILTFHGNFESSNIDEVVYLGKNRYFITIRKDVNSDLKQLYENDLSDISQEKLNQLRKGKGKGWFMFEVSNMVPGREYVFYIAGFRKNDSLFARGMMPTYMYYIKQMKETYTESGEKLIGEVDGLDEIIDSIKKSEISEKISFGRGNTIFNGHKGTMNCYYMPQYYGYKTHPINQSMARLVNPDGEQSMLKIVFKTPAIDISLYKLDNEMAEDNNNNNNSTISDNEVKNKYEEKSSEKRVRFNLGKYNGINIAKSKTKQPKDEQLNNTKNTTIIKPTLSMIISLTFPYTYTMMKDMVDRLVFKMNSYGLKVKDKLGTKNMMDNKNEQEESGEDSIDKLINKVKEVQAKEPEEFSNDENDLSSAINELRNGMIKKKTDLVVSKLCNDFGFNVPLIKLGRGPCKIIVIGRIHPCETPSSYIIHGLINSLIDWKRDCEIDKATDDVLSHSEVPASVSVSGFHRDNKTFTFDDFLASTTLYIVPMVNCSGVICGNSRTNIMGTDLNRSWLSSSMCDAGNIYYVRKLLREISNGVNNDNNNNNKDNNNNSTGREMKTPSNRDRKGRNINNSKSESSERSLYSISNNYPPLSVIGELPDQKHTSLSKEVSQQQQQQQQAPSGISLFLDIHGHMKKPNIFTYGCSNPVDAEYFYNERLFPFILDNENTRHRSEERRHTFLLDYCKYNVAPSKMSTSRVFVRRSLGVIHSYTIEASMGLFKDTGEKGKGLLYPLTPSDYLSMGHDILEAMKKFVSGNFYEEAKRVKTEAAVLKEKLVGAGGVLIGRPQTKGSRKFVVDDVQNVKSRTVEVSRSKEQRAQDVEIGKSVNDSILPSLNLVPGCVSKEKRKVSFQTCEEQGDSSLSERYSLPLESIPGSSVQKRDRSSDDAHVVLSPMKPVSGTRKIQDTTERRETHFSHNQNTRFNNNTINAVSTDRSDEKSDLDEQPNKISLTYDVPLFDRAVNDPAFKKVNKCLLAAVVVAKHEKEQEELREAELRRARRQSSQTHKRGASLLTHKSEGLTANSSEDDQNRLRKKTSQKRARSLMSGGEMRAKSYLNQQQCQQKIVIPVAKQILTLPTLEIESGDSKHVSHYALPTQQSNALKQRGRAATGQNDNIVHTKSREKRQRLRVQSTGDLQVVQSCNRNARERGLVVQHTLTRQHQERQTFALGYNISEDFK